MKEIDMDKLTAYIIDNCSELTLSDSGNMYCQKKLREICNVPQYMRDTCPDDCPRIHNVSTKCDKETCEKVIKTLKKLTK